MHNTNYFKLVDKCTKNMERSSSGMEYIELFNLLNDKFYNRNRPQAIIKSCSLALDWILSNTTITKDDLRAVYMKSQTKTDYQL